MYGCFEWKKNHQFKLFTIVAINNNDIKTRLKWEKSIIKLNTNSTEKYAIYANFNQLYSMQIHRKHRTRILTENVWERKISTRTSQIRIQQQKMQMWVFTAKVKQMQIFNQSIAHGEYTHYAKWAVNQNQLPWACSRKTTTYAQPTPIRFHWYGECLHQPQIFQNSSTRNK